MNEPNFDDEPPKGVFMLSVQEAADLIESELNATPVTTENPLRLKLCMEDARTAMGFQMIFAWCQKFKELEGKKILKVSWETDPDPKRSYIRHLVITTE